MPISPCALVPEQPERPSSSVDGITRGVLGVFLFVPFLLGAADPPPVRSPCSLSYPSDGTIAWDCRKIKKGESLESLFGERWVDVARFNRIDRRHVRPGVSLKVPRRLDELASFTPLPSHYPPAEFEERLLLIDLSEQFLGAYELGALRFSMPIASGEPDNPTPTGEFRLTLAHRDHVSTLYMIEDRDMPYPMTYALLFHINRQGVAYWIHGRDLPGAPVSHGCIGLYDEDMQKRVYGVPKQPELRDAKRLFEWVTGTEELEGKQIPLKDGPKVHIIGAAPEPGRAMKRPQAAGCR